MPCQTHWVEVSGEAMESGGFPREFPGKGQPNGAESDDLEPVATVSPFAQARRKLDYFLKALEF